MVKIVSTKEIDREPIAYAGIVHGMFFPMDDGSNRWVFVNYKGRATIYSTVPRHQHPVYKGATIEWTFE